MANKKLTIADLFKDKWTQAVTLSITILAVCAAISSLKASSFSTKVSLYTTMESKGWAYFQSKSIKQHTSEEQLHLYQLYHLQATSPSAKAFIQKQITSLEKDISRYDTEKATIKKETEALSHQQEDFKKQSASFSLATMLLQICIMMSSVSTLTQKKLLWGLGLLFGSIGILYMVNGFLILF